MFSNPQKNIEQFILGEDWHVADFGTGSGAYALAAARAVGPDGKVYAIDVKTETLSRLKKEADTARLHNIEILRGNLEKLGGSGLRDEACDAIIISNVLFQIDDRQVFVREVGRVLKKGGKVLVVDWSQSFGGVGPEAGAVYREDAAQELFTGAGFSYERSIDAGAHHYGLIFKKKE